MGAAVLVVALPAGVLGAWMLLRPAMEETLVVPTAAGARERARPVAAEPSEGHGPSASAAPPPAPAPARWVDPTSVGQSYGSAVAGLLTFRGNPTRTYYGRGPVPRNPQVAWRYPQEGGMCGESTVGDETTSWCGAGWTGQPAVFERAGRTWIVFGAYDHRVHFLDAATGEPILPPFSTGDIIKGSVTVDPDGYPIVYTGSRDNRFRLLAFDGREPVELWALDAASEQPTRWNDDWDGSGLVIDDHLLIGGENSRFYIVKLNRGYDAEGRVTVDPQVVFDTAGWDEQLLTELGDGNVSIEGSVAVHGDTVYFANSGGLVQGWDLGELRDGNPPLRTFRFWTGDDTDATVVVDEQGMLYVASEVDRGTARGREVGQVLKLDPSYPQDPVVWSVADPSGVWGTPALHGAVLYVPTDGGRLLALDRATGSLRWFIQLPEHLWSSPVVVDGLLLQGDCEGVLHAWDVRDAATAPAEAWTVHLGGCIEATPAVWDGGIYLATRAGQLIALR